MDNKVYYGEYSLKHWIDLILKKNITLPEYQRSYVWSENALQRFIKALEEKQFIPPVTIAHYKVKNENTETNLILDGQQRLTSLLLAAIGYYPDKSKFEDAENITKSENDNEEDNEVADDTNNELLEGNKPIKWTFNQLLEFGNNIESIRSKIKDIDKYHSLNESFLKNDDFLEETFLGFSYIVPTTEDVQRLFSKTFREINYFGESLTAQESRRSLYFMNDKYKDFLDGKIEHMNVLGSLNILENRQPKKIDFIRYLSILSQYKVTQSSSNALKYYSSLDSRETFYVDYVSFILGIDQESYKDKFNGFSMTETFPNECWKKRFKTLYEATSAVKINLRNNNSKDNFESWIDADYYLFGLIYYILFENSEVKLENSLFNELKVVIDKKRKDSNSSYSKSPNKLKFIRERLSESIAIYSKYTKSNI